ncbi:MAG: zinc-ribbon domain-containing protein [Clostridia bacterium]|nr:zinc-ribbon domain-containing protein [Clostridia bacterium]
MFCPQCGAQHEDDAVFCSKCGTQLNPTTEKSSASYPTPQYRQPSVFDGFANTYNSYANRKLSSIPTIDAFKKLCLSPIALIAVISFTLMVLMNLSKAEVVGVLIQDAVSTFVDVFSTSLWENVLDVIESSYMFTAILINLPDILTAVGMWMLVYSAALKSDTMSSSGLGLIRVMNTISIVLTAIVLALSAVICFALFSLFGFSNAAEFFFAALILLGGTGFRLFYLIKVNDSIDCIRYAVDRHIPTVGLSSLVTVMCFVTGIFSVANVFTDLGDIEYLSDLASSTNMFTAIAYICFGILILQYKRSMEPLRHISANQQSEGSVNYSYQENYHYQETYKSSESNFVNKALFYGIGCIVFVIVIVAVAIIHAASNSSDIDQRIVGKWRYNSNAEAIMEFKSNGVYIANEDTEYEETGVYTTEDGVIAIMIDGEESERNYRVINSDNIQIERSYWGGMDWETEWVDLYKVT